MDKKTEKKYLAIMRQKSGQERLKIAMELRELVLKMAKEGIKHQHPNIPPGDLKAYLQERIYGRHPPTALQGKNMDLVSLLKIVANRLEKAGIPYMITGGVAVSYWGFPRTTHDIDIVIEAKKEDKEKIVTLFEKDFYISSEATEDAIEKRFTFNIIHLKSGTKVDFWLVKKDAFGSSEFKRRLRRKIYGKEIFIISPEDLVLSKLLAYKETQSHLRLEDAKSILKTSKTDLNYIKSWAKKQSTIKILNEILEKERK